MGATAAMTQTSRKLLGTLGLIVLLIAYPLAIAEVYARFFMALPWWAAILILAAAGAAWFFPASWVVRWMSRPD